MSDVCVQILDLTTGELVDSNPIGSQKSEDNEFRLEVERCQTLAARDADFEPVAVELVAGELVMKREEVRRPAAKESA